MIWFQNSNKNKTSLHDLQRIVSDSFIYKFRLQIDYTIKILLRNTFQDFLKFKILFVRIVRINKDMVLS